MFFLMLACGYLILFGIGFCAASALTIMLIIAGVTVALGAIGIIALETSDAPSGSSGGLGLGLLCLAVVAAGLMLGFGALIGYALS